MNGIIFDGQQEGERILAEVRPHELIRRWAVARIALVSILLTIITLVIGFPVGILAAVLVLMLGMWWNSLYFRDTRAYVTDRRIIRFERMSPFVVTKRALFWNEALKAKAYEPNLILRTFKLGTLTVEPHIPGGENVVVRHVHYAEDLANYIDKILFIFKSTPSDISALHPFIAKPRGQRG